MAAPVATLVQQQQQQQQQQQPRKRKCAEVLVELTLIEAVRTFGDPDAGAAAPAAASLETIGLRVGRQLAERYTREKTRQGDTLEIIKFICKEFWQTLWKKQVDNLRTNHRGIYVLQDNSFRWLQRLAPSAQPSGDPARDEALRRMALDHLNLPCGIIRGALCHLGVPCTVEADPKVLPACAFTIKIV